MLFGKGVWVVGTPVQSPNHTLSALDLGWVNVTCLAAKWHNNLREFRSIVCSLIGSFFTLMGP